MYKETDSNGQYVLDCRLDHERSLEDNVVKFVDFATECRKVAVNGSRVKNRHEGYGFLAEAHQNLIHSAKVVKDSMTDLLNVLPSDDTQAVDKVENIYSALLDCVKAGAEMAAEAKRVSNDIYREGWNPSLDTDDDGFAEPE